jgi:hypothetical protein
VLNLPGNRGYKLSVEATVPIIAVMFNISVRDDRGHFRDPQVVIGRWALYRIHVIHQDINDLRQDALWKNISIVLAVSR